MNDSKSLSVVIPLWNEERNIEALVKEFHSCRFTTSSNFELVLVNNGSTDNSARVLESTKSRYSWVRLLSLPTNLNYGGGIQAGIGVATGALIAFMPGDLQVKPLDVLR